MPSDQSYWLISAPWKNGDEDDLFRSIKTVVSDNTPVGVLELPGLKAGTLSSLLTLSDSLPKHDAYFTSTVSKLLDTIKGLVGDGSGEVKSGGRGGSGSGSGAGGKGGLEGYLKVNDLPPTQYLLPHPGSPSAQNGWRWDKSRWGADGKVGEVVEALVKEMNSIDSVQKQKTQSYNLAKGTLTALQRKKMGNLSTKSLVGIVGKGDVVNDSEYMETLLVAVPNSIIKDWHDKYERLTAMVVPRSSAQIAKDDEYTLMSVTVFKKVKEEYLHKCRENKFLAREYTFDEGAVEKQDEELTAAAAEEKELWSDLLRLSRTNFSEAYQLLVHLKVARVFVESVLRYGLPAEYSAMVIQPDPKTSLKTLKTLSSYFTFLKSKERTTDSKGKSSSGNDEIAGEWGAVMEQEYYDFVLFEVPKVIT